MCTLRLQAHLPGKAQRQGVRQHKQQRPQAPQQLLQLHPQHHLVPRPQQMLHPKIKA